LCDVNVAIELQRVYDERVKRGKRFLVERLWPRGIRKDALPMHAWQKEVAPSDALRRWFAHDVTKWPEFRRRYRAELDRHPQSWQPILDAARAGRVVLLFSSRDTEHNNAVVLRDYLQQKLNDPAGT
jgi:uncharacterized protein YeaO (DUF488 family)